MRRVDKPEINHHNIPHYPRIQAWAGHTGAPRGTASFVPHLGVVPSWSVSPGAPLIKGLPWCSIAGPAGVERQSQLDETLAAVKQACRK
jgi:hypothetical protein